MANTALAVAEAALRSRKLDRTLTTHLAPLTSADPSAITTDIAALDACVRGGLPRGQLSELAGPRSSGRTSVLLQTLAAATHRGEIAAIVDTFDALDLASLVDAGVDLDRLLWIRGHDISPGIRPGALIDRVVERALKACSLVLQAGGFGVVALDFGDVSMPTLQRLPYTTWLRVQRMIEGSDTACLLIVPQPLARSAGGLTLSLTAQSTWMGDADRSRRLTGLEVDVRVLSPRRQIQTDVHVRCALRG